MALLKSARASGKLTPEGEAWLLKALDPFHDTTLRAPGLPDGVAESTTISEINQSVTIAKPAGVTGQWDLHVFHNPDIAYQQLYPVGASATGLWTARRSTSTVGGYPRVPFVNLIGPGSVSYGGGLNWVAVPTGTITVPDSQTVTGDPAPGTLASGSVTGRLDVSKYIVGRCRVIAGGFEAHNVTPELYRGGTITSYRIVQARVPDCGGLFPAAIDTGVSAVATPMPAVLSLAPPQTMAEALVVPGSRQWAADDGVYTVLSFDPHANPLRSWDYRQRIFTDAPTLWGAQNTNSPTENLLATSGMGTFWINESGNTVFGTPPCSALETPLHLSGVYFTGLDPNAVITLTYKIVLEVAPEPESVLATYAISSPPDDMYAREIFARVCMCLPPGVAVAENGLGDWFKSALGFISKAAPVVGGLFGAPGKMIGAGLGALAGLGANAIGGRSSGGPAAPPKKPQTPAQKRSVRKKLIRAGKRPTY